MMKPHIRLHYTPTVPWARGVPHWHVKVTMGRDGRHVYRTQWFQYSPRLALKDARATAWGLHSPMGNHT